VIDIFLEFIIEFAYIGGLIACVAGIFYVRDLHQDHGNDQ
jgi:hypothetical protein